MTIDSGPEREKAKERIDAIRSIEIGSYPKAELILIVLGLKPATELDLAPWNDSPETIENALSTAGLVYRKKEPTNTAERDGWTTYLIASKQQDVERLAMLDAAVDHQEYGRLMGFPDSAIRAFHEGTTLSIEEHPDDPENIIQMSFSKEHWREELDHAKKLSQAVKEFAPDVYQELKGEDTP